VALLRTLHANKTLRHLDIRHNSLSGDLAMRCIGEMLQENSHLTHLELSWNPFGPECGQILLEHLSMNTTLFDCQLTGCQMAPDTLLSIAQLLQRNRVAKGANLEAGPYRGRWHCTGGGSGPSGAGAARSLGEAEAPLSPPEPGGVDPTGLSGRHGTCPLIVSSQQTEEYINRLLVWRAARREKAPADGSTETSQDMLECLDQLQKEMDRQREGGDDVQNRTKLLIEGFQDRELRYRNDIAGAQNKLSDFANEHKELRSMISRLSEQLNLLREAVDDTKRSLSRDHQRYEAEEARSKNDLATVTSERMELAERLKELEDQAARKEEENAKLRSRTREVREGVILVDRR